MSKLTFEGRESYSFGGILMNVNWNKLGADKT